MKEMQINEQIRDREVRVISSTGEQLGIMSAKDALKKAEEKNLDLVKIAPTAKPPVCKIMDYGKYRFEQAKREKELRKRAKKLVKQGVAEEEARAQAEAQLLAEEAPAPEEPAKPTVEELLTEIRNLLAANAKSENAADESKNDTKAE